MEFPHKMVQEKARFFEKLKLFPKTEKLLKIVSTEKSLSLEERF